MVKYSAAAITILLKIGSVDCFGPRLPTLSSVRRASASPLQRNVSSPGLYDYGENSDSSLTIRATLSAAYADAFPDGVADEEDPFEKEQALKQLKKKTIRERSGNYEVSLPIVKGSDIGVSLCEFDAGEVSDVDLNLDTLRFQSHTLETSTSSDQGANALIQTMDQTSMMNRLGPSFRGVVVASVITDSIAWKKGIRPGHVLVATSATLGEALWPKSTLEGVRSAIGSRKNLSPTMRFEFQRADVAGIAEHYELTIPRPIGLQLEETDDGYVRVAGFTESAPRLIKYAVQLGDRILAVDSIAGKMWPVSTIDGVISACTARLPGQPVKIQFARPYLEGRGEITVGKAAVLDMRELDSMEASSTPTLATNVVETSHNALLSRCRNVLRRYMLEADTQTKHKYAVPAIVADRVLEAVASASASLNAETLSLVMSAYLSCRKPERAIRAFEAAVGLKADGSSAAVTTVIEGKDKGEGSLVADSSALNLYTATSLLRAHALTGDLQSVKRVLSALEGRSGTMVNGIEVASWPGTGESGLITLDTTCYNTALAAAAKNGSTEAIEMALQLFESLEDPESNSENPEKDLVSYNTIIGALSKAGLWSNAFAVFDRMNMARIKPDKYTYTSLIRACVRDGDIQELLIDMKERGVEPDVVTYNTIIKALCDSYKWFEAKKLITEMEQRGIAANSMTYGLLMNALLKANKPSACLTLFETACSDSRTAAVTENVQLYTTAIAATSALGNYERGLDLISRMNAAGVRPNLKTLTSLMGSCLASGKASMAIDVYSKIEKPDGYAKTLAIQAFSDAGDFDSAAELLSTQCDGRGDMSGKEIMSSYNKLLYSALSAKDYAMARRTFSELLLGGYIPSKVTYHKIIDALELGPKKNVSLQKPDEESFDFLLFVLDSIQQRKLSCDGSFYASAVFCGARLGGSRKKISVLLKDARGITADTGMATTLITAQKEGAGTTDWQDLLLHYEEYKEEIGNTIQLPYLSVNVADRNIRQVLSAERAVAYSSVRKPTRKL